MSKVLDAVRERIFPIIERLGYEVVDAEYKNLRDKNMHLVFYIYNEKGVGLDDCERVSNAIDGPLDELDPTGGAPYCLDVSSPGLDRPFKTARDYERNMGKEIEIKLYGPVKLDPADPKRKAERLFEGVLRGFDGAAVTFERDGKLWTLPVEKTASVRQAVRF
ncbi:MAG: ribosome maturation factor RimP [Clostridiales bacterium]|jgi:ribosome maturation factor RimP|nr:ribosome maturation factor RimP [Clostridiales bacterium]